MFGNAIITSNGNVNPPVLPTVIKGEKVISNLGVRDILISSYGMYTGVCSSKLHMM